eukprot:3346010-Amphidinium_carterae.2
MSRRDVTVINYTMNVLLFPCHVQISKNSQTATDANYQCNAVVARLTSVKAANCTARQNLNVPISAYHESYGVVLFVVVVVLVVVVVVVFLVVPFVV